jgi:DNA-binding winged helix-turn-helix (wHTH) protein/TolB-like protein
MLRHEGDVWYGLSPLDSLSEILWKCFRIVSIFLSEAGMASAVFYCFGPFRLDPAERRVLRGGDAIPMAPKVFDTLLVLVEARGRLVGKDALMARVWPGTFVEDVNLARNISLIRKTLGEQDGQKYVETVPKCGYRFVAPVRTAETGDGVAPARESVAPQDDAPVPGPPERRCDMAPPPAGNRFPRRAGWGGAARARAVTVAAFVFTATGTWMVWPEQDTGSAANDAPIRSLAVLPFTPLALAGAGDYLSVGLADTVITRLIRTHGVVVRPTSTVYRYAGQPVDTLTAGRALKVDAVLEGSIQRTDHQIRLSVRLVRVADGKPIWGEVLDEDATELFELEDRMAARLADALAARFTH